MTATWSDNRELMRELWPTAEMTPALCGLFHESLHYRNQEWVTIALKNVRKRYSSKTPELKWILAAFFEHRDTLHASQPRVARNTYQDQNLEEVLVENGRRIILGELKKADEGDLALAINDVRQVVSLCSVESDKTDPELWSDLARGFIWAAIQQRKEKGPLALSEAL